MSISTLLVLNFERYTAIIHPLWHRKSVTKQRLIFIWVILLLIVAVNTVFVFLNWRISIIITIITISTLCFTSLFTYASIFRAARKRKSLTSCNALGYHTNFGNFNGEASGNMASFLRELKMAKTYFIIVLLAFACFLPAGIFAILESTYTWSKTEPLVIAYPWVITLISMNSTLNCLIFFWANKMLRREAVKHVKNFFSKENSS